MRQILFDEIGTHENWDLILTSYEISDPPVKTKYVDIPAGDGELDLTETFGGLNYEARTATFNFIVTQPHEEWADLRRRINDFVHGKKRIIREPDDPDYYYIGRCEVESFRRQVGYATLTISGRLEPYRLKNEPTIINVTLNNSKEVELSLKNERKPVIPIIKTTDDILIDFNNEVYSVGNGSHRITNIILKEGYNPMTITGTQGTNVQIEYREGAI